MAHDDHKDRVKRIEEIKKALYEPAQKGYAYVWGIEEMTEACRFLLSTIASLQQEAVESSANFLSEQGLRISIAGVNKRLEEIIYSQKDRIVGLQREVERLEKLYGLLSKTHEVTLDKCDQARAAVGRLEEELSQLKPITLECVDCKDIIDGLVNDRGHLCPPTGGEGE